MEVFGIPYFSSAYTIFEGKSFIRFCEQFKEKDFAQAAMLIWLSQSSLDLSLILFGSFFLFTGFTFLFWSFS